MKGNDATLMESGMVASHKAGWDWEYEDDWSWDWDFGSMRSVLNILDETIYRTAKGRNQEEMA